MVRKIVRTTLSVLGPKTRKDVAGEEGPRKKKGENDWFSYGRP